MHNIISETILLNQVTGQSHEAQLTKR